MPGRSFLSIHPRSLGYRYFSRLAFLVLLISSQSIAQESAKAKKELAADSTEALVARLKRSLVTIRTTSRDGDQLGLGTGFIIDSEGLIATNFHVIGEGRPIQIELSDKRKLAVTSVEASSRREDLVILRVAKPQFELTPLKLSSADPMISAGATVLALGNPLGLQQSVVQGVVSAWRTVDHQELIQLAIPIEPGNSGGPLVDLKGIVHGIVNMKSSVAKNIGFAIPIKKLLELRQHPNPIPIERWIRFTGIDASRWSVVHGGEWIERSSVLRVASSGSGFAGRTVCLSQLKVDPKKFEAAVDVKLDVESGAAGLVFHGDEQGRHYAFYPSNGKIRLTCFRGDDVLSWEVLHDAATRYYLHTQWNRLHVAVDGDRIQGFVNGTMVVEVKHRGLQGNRVGVASFRGTPAQFRNFQAGDRLEEASLSEEMKAWIRDAADGISKPTSLDELLTAKPPQAQRMANELDRLASRLEKRAERIKQLAEDSRIYPILQSLSALATSDEADGLMDGALWIAALEHPELDVAYYLQRVQKMSEELRGRLPTNADDNAKLDTLHKYLFEENGFRGGRDEYYHPANNQMDRVIDDREGMPIALAVLYLELGRKLGLNLDGIGLPGHFVVRYQGESKKSTRFIDVFEQAKTLSNADVSMMVMMNQQRMVTDDDLLPQTNIEILSRMLRNLIASAEQEGDTSSLYRYFEALAVLHPDDIEYRRLRGIARYQSDRLEKALEDFDWMLEHSTNEDDLQQLATIRKQITDTLAEREP